MKKMSAKEFSAGSLIPLKCSNLNDEIVDVIICSSISGGSNYENNMPKNLTLIRKDFENNKLYEASYILQSSLEIE